MASFGFSSFFGEGRSQRHLRLKASVFVVVVVFCVFFLTCKSAKYLEKATSTG